MSDHFGVTYLEDRTHGEEYWSAAEEFCSCQSDDGSCTCNRDDDDHDDREEREEYEYFCICIPTHPREAADSGGALINAETQYDLQLSSGSGDDKTDSKNVQIVKQEEVSVIQRMPQTYPSIKKAEGGTTGENKNVVNTKSVGLVLGNRQLSSVTGSTCSSVTDHDENSETIDNHKDSIPFESDYQESDHDKTAENMLGVHEDSPRRVSKHNKRLDRVRMKAKFLSHKHQQSTKESDINQGTCRDHTKERNINGSSSDQSCAEIFIPRDDLPTNQSRDESELVHQSKTSEVNQNAQENGVESYPCQLTKKPDDLMILVKSNVPVSTSIEEMNANVSVSIHRHKDKINYEVVSEEKETNFNQENRAESLSQSHKNNKDTDTETREKGLCDRCSKHPYKHCCEQRGKSYFPREELETPKNTPNDHSKNGYTNGDQLLPQPEQQLQVETEGSEKTFTPIQTNRRSDKMKSIQFSILGLSHLKAGKEKAEVDPTSTTQDSISTRANKPELEKIPDDADAKEMHLDDLHTNNSRNSDEEKHDHGFMKGAIQKFEVESDDERHALSSQKQTANASVEGKDEIVENRTQAGVHFFEYLNASYCDAKNGDVPQRDALRKELKRNSTKDDEATETDLLMKTNRFSSVKSDSPNTLQTIVDFPSNQSLNYILYSPTKVRKPQNNTSKNKNETVKENNVSMQTKPVSGDKSDNPKALQKNTSNELSSDHPQTNNQENRSSPMFKVKKLEMGATKNNYDNVRGTNFSMEAKNISNDKSNNHITSKKHTVDEYSPDQSQASKHSPISKVEKVETDTTKTLKYDNTVGGEGFQYLAYPLKTPRNQSLYKSSPVKKIPSNERRTHSRESDERSVQSKIRKALTSEGEFDNKSRISHSRYARGAEKVDIRRPQSSASHQSNESTLLGNDDNSSAPSVRSYKNCQRKLDDADSLADKYPPEIMDNLMMTVGYSDQEVRETGMNNTNSDFTAKASFSISDNMKLSERSQKKYFYDMWLKGKFCDVNVVVDDHTFLAHRVVLAANSKYFEQFFLNTTKTDDIDLQSVFISDMSADVFRDILGYMYTGDLEIQFSHVSQLLRGSLFLLINNLTNALQSFLLNTWKGECIGAFCLAQTAGLHDLHREILSYIRSNFIEVSLSEHFALCPVEHASCILSDDNLLINGEMDILYAVLLWLKHHKRDISSNLRMLRHVRFEYIPLKKLESIENSHLNSISNESARRYIQDARKRASCLDVDQLHFDPPIIRQRIAEIVGSRSVKRLDSELITEHSSMISDEEKGIGSSKERRASSHSRSDWSVSETINAKNGDRFSKTSDKDGQISSSKEEQSSSYSRSDWSLSPIHSSPALTKSSQSVNTKTEKFPSYHEIDTTSIQVKLSQDESVSPLASNDDLGQSSSHESAEDETNVQIVRSGGISRTWKEDCVHSDIEKLDRRRTKRWEEWTSFVELPVSVHHHTACYIHNSIYIAGGHVQLPCDASTNHFQPSRLFHVYDLMKAKWYRLADLEQARVFHQMVALFGQIYVIGGQGSDGGALAAVDRYSPYTDSWRQVAPLSFPRYATAAAAYNFHLWVAGGASNDMKAPYADRDGSHQDSGNENGANAYDGFYKSTTTFVTGVVECYSPHDNRWTKVNGLPTPRCHASLLRINKSLFLVGGFSCIRHFPNDDSSTSSIDVYDDVKESWRPVTEVEEGSYGANTVAVGSKIVILGKPGPFLESSGDVLSIFDTSTDKWEMRRSLLLEARVGHACCAIPVATHSPLRRTM